MVWVEPGTLFKLNIFAFLYGRLKFLILRTAKSKMLYDHRPPRKYVRAFLPVF